MCNRAEQFARKLYTPWSEDGMSRKDNTEVIEACIKGYEQAEKDLALSWEDVRKLCSLSFVVEVDLGREISDKQHYEEVLRRFNESKNK